MKTLLATLVFSTTLLAAPNCKVYGITDGPQSLSCKLKGKFVKLSCLKGRYYLNGSEVKEAFHMEVEEGTVPLVFKASDMTLTVMMDSPISADLVSKDGELSGLCTL
jgi:hypothetical protein